MKIIKPVLIGISALAVAFLAVFGFFAIPWLLIYADIQSSPNPPAPEVTYGEFPFEIVYEMDGKTYTVNDVYVCEYDGIDMNEGIGKYRSWKGYIKSTGEEKYILLDDGDLKLAVSLGNPNYYMSDPDKAQEEYEPYIYYIKSHEGGARSEGILDIEPLLEQYKIELISWKLSEPIENSFGRK